jgi:hypothetical protein
LGSTDLTDFAAFRNDLMPTSGRGEDTFLAIKEEEEAAPPPAIPLIPRPPYVAPQYAPKPARN